DALRRLDGVIGERDAAGIDGDRRSIAGAGEEIAVDSAEGGSDGEGRSVVSGASGCEGDRQCAVGRAVGLDDAGWSASGEVDVGCPGAGDGEGVGGCLGVVRAEVDKDGLRGRRSAGQSGEVKSRENFAKEGVGGY